MKSIKFSLITAAMITLWGCQSTPEPLDVEQNTNSSTINSSADSLYSVAKDSYNVWQAKLNNAAELSIYSPEHYQDLNKAWKEATDIFVEMKKDPQLANQSYSFFSSKSYATVYQEFISQVEANYNQLISFKNKADITLADAIAQMDYFSQIDASSVFPSAFVSINDDFHQLFIKVRDDKLEAAQQGQVQFLKKSRELEVKINNKRYIEPLQKQAAILKNEGIAEVAPQTFVRLESEIKLAANVVITNPRDQQAILESVERAKFEARHVSQVAHQIKLLAAVEDEQFETTVLEIENKLLGISHAIDGSDYRDSMLREQAEKILASVKKLKEQNRSDLLKSEVDELRAQLQQLKLVNQQQADALQLSKDREAALQEQIVREDKYMKSLEVLVASLKQTNQQAVTPAPEAAELNAKPQAASEVAETPVKAEQTEAKVTTPIQPVTQQVETTVINSDTLTD